MKSAKMNIWRKVYPIQFPIPNLKNKAVKNENAHQSLCSCIIVGQIFGIFPVHGVTSKDPRNLKFKWKSLKVLYSTLVLFGLTFLLIINLISTFTTVVCLGKIMNILFFSFAFMESIAFFHLAMNWPKLMKHWVHVDETFKNYYGYPKNLDFKLKLTMTVLLFVAAVEYILALSNNASNYHGSETEPTASWEVFSKHQFSSVFRYFSYDIGKSIILLLINTIATFLWSYTDLFVMICSFTLAARFKQITEKLEKADTQVQNEFFWRNIREDFDRLAFLCRILDETISSILLLSYASNLSFIIYQLFNSIKKLFHPLEKGYFYLSFIFIIARTVAISLSGASINDESKEPIRILNSVSSSAYNGEVKRFLLHLKLDLVALTGHNLFKLTRGFILSVAATVVTYELVLIQFNQATLDRYQGNETLDSLC